MFSRANSSRPLEPTGPPTMARTAPVLLSIATSETVGWPWPYGRSDAIVWSAGKPAVYVERDAGTFERRSLALAAALPGAWLVTDGVAAGERVVTTGAGQLLSAQTLTPKAE